MSRALLLAVFAGSVVAVTMLLPRDDIYADAAQVADLATYPVLLAAAALLYVYYRLSPGEGAHWLAAAAAFGTAQGVGYAALRVVLEDEIRDRPGWMLFSHVVVAAVLCLMLAMPGRLRTPVDPVVLGLSLAFAITGARLVAMDRMNPAPVLQDLTPVLALALTILYGLMAVMLTLSHSVPEWASWRLAVVVASLGLAQVLSYPVPVDDWRSLVVVILDVGGAGGLLAVTSMKLVRTAVTRTDAAEARVRTALEAHLRNDRTLIHEVAGTVAGISAASQLLSLPAGLEPQERRRLRGACGRRDRPGRQAADRVGDRRRPG